MDPGAEYDGDHKDTSTGTVTIILIDGLSKNIFLESLQRDRLPYFKKLVEQSTYVVNGIGAFPSMTGYAFYPFITGMKAPDSGIYGLRWFDRSLNQGNLRNYVGRTNVEMNNDITDEYFNLFELNSDFYTASINTYMNRGVHHSLKTGWAHTTAKYSKVSMFPFIRKIPFFGEEMAKDHFQHETLVTDLAIEQLKLNPKIQWITYPSLDAHNHVHGTDDTYYQLLEHLDQEINRLDKTIKELGQSDRMLAIVSDHGILDVHVNVDVPGILKSKLGLQIERGPSTHLDTDKLSDPLADFINDDGYFVINGNLSAYLYLRDPEKSGMNSWRQPLSGKTMTSYPTPTGKTHIPEFISSIEGIELVSYWYSSDSLMVMRGAGKAIIHSDSSGYFVYHPIIGDPLRMSNYLNYNEAYHQDSILARTAESDYPYAIVRLWELMDVNNPPDIVLTTSEGYDIARDYEIFVDNYKGGHGGIHRNLLAVPYILRVPGQPSETISVAKAEDVGATIMKFLSIKPGHELSGTSLID